MAHRAQNPLLTVVDQMPQWETRNQDSKTRATLPFRGSQQWGFRSITDSSCGGKAESLALSSSSSINRSYPLAAITGS